jgi:hypothetical protein
MPLVYIILFYFTFFFCFLCFTGLWKKMRRLWKSGLKEKKEEKLDAIERRRPVDAIERRRPAIERTNTRAPKARIERTCVHVQKKETNRSAIERTCV